MPLQWRRKLSFIALAAFLAGVMFTGGCYLARDLFPGKKNNTNNGVAVAELLPGVGPDAIADVVSAAGPAVVKISTFTDTGGERNPFFNDPFFRQFFNFAPRQKQTEEGLGSGFIISKDGYILTNEHVIEGASRIAVTVAGFDKNFTAKVVGADIDLDLSLLKIDTGADLPFLTLGNSDQVRVGNWVIAIGNPYGLDHTVTTGVISAKGRPITVQERRYENLLQTDASINPGNSGGPLLNINGEVIGINTAINAQAQGIGFAIPTSTVQRVLQDMRNSENVSRPWIGVQVRPVDAETARYLGLERAEGALVAEVVRGGPADKAGIKQWDVIVEINGDAVKNADDLVNRVRGIQPGQAAEVLALRRQQAYRVNITITEKPKNVR
ncbi:MAG: S1C family serine protease [Eubacteriales bacterium]